MQTQTTEAGCATSILLTEEVLQIGALSAHVGCGTAGGVASFIGTTRDNFDGKRVTRLEVPPRARRPPPVPAATHRARVPRLPQYEAYRPMAEREMLAVCARMRERWPDLVPLTLRGEATRMDQRQSQIKIAIVDILV